MSDDWDDDLPFNFTSYEEISNRPLFKAEVDTTKSQIEKLLVPYKFPERHPCGKKDCHQPHNNGWLALTNDNQETLIGSKCGREWGGDTFVFQRNQLNKRIKRTQQLAILNTALRNSEITLDRINEIKRRPNGATWLDTAIRKLESSCTPEVMRLIRKKALRGETAVEVPKLKTKEERDLDAVTQAGNPSSLYKLEVIGHFAGLELFSMDLRTTLIVGIFNKVKTLQSTNLDVLSTPALNNLAKEINQFDLLFANAEVILSIGKQFFSTTSNFQLIKALDKDGQHAHLINIDWMNLK